MGIRITTGNMKCILILPLVLLNIALIDAEYKYKGCYKDYWLKRQLNGKIELNLWQNSVENCADFCKGFKYFAVQYGKNCFCGDNPRVSKEAKDPSECNRYDCPGNLDQKCGGYWRNSLYEVVDGPIVDPVPEGSGIDCDKCAGEVGEAIKQCAVTVLAPLNAFNCVQKTLGGTSQCLDCLCQLLKGIIKIVACQGQELTVNREDMEEMMRIEKNRLGDMEEMRKIEEVRMDPIPGGYADGRPY